MTRQASTLPMPCIENTVAIIFPRIFGVEDSLAYVAESGYYMETGGAGEGGRDIYIYSIYIYSIYIYIYI